MKKHLGILTLVATAILIPSIASTAMSGDTTSQTTSGELRQFGAEGSLVTGELISATIVAPAGEEGRAQVALSGAISRAQQFSAEFFGSGGIASQLAGLGKGNALELSPIGFDFIKRARVLAPQTDGFFDIAAPSPKHIFIKSDWRRISLDDELRTITFKSGDIKLDLTKIALGYACDLMMETMLNDGFQNASVTAGMVTRNTGRDIHTPWDVVVGFGETTSTGTHRAYRYGLSNVGAATVTPGGLGSNLVDPINKRQINWNGQLQSVTVIATDAMTATAFALAAYTLGPKYSIKFVKGQHSIRGIIVDGTGNLIASKDLGIDSMPYEQNRQTSADGGPNDLRQKEREEKTR